MANCGSNPPNLLWHTAPLNSGPSSQQWDRPMAFGKASDHRVLMSPLIQTCDVLNFCFVVFTNTHTVEKRLASCSKLRLGCPCKFISEVFKVISSTGPCDAWILSLTLPPSGQIVYVLEKEMESLSQILRRETDCFFFKKYFYWSRVDLKCCVSFCCTAKWYSYTKTYIHSLDSFPTYIITGYWVEFFVL